MGSHPGPDRPGAAGRPDGRPSRHTAGVFDRPRGQALEYLQYLPAATSPDGRLPLILFLHGAGERGRDLEVLKRHGIPLLIESRPDFPFAVVSPQCPPARYWTDLVPACVALLAQLTAALPVDPDRVYVTGMSMGGYGTWHLAAAIPERLAAVAPVCGGGLRSRGFPERVCELGRLPVWAFHGAQDTIVPPAESVVLVETLRRCGGDARLTVYPDLAHDAWTRTYEDPELYRWLLSHRRLRA